MNSPKSRLLFWNVQRVSQWMSNVSRDGGGQAGLAGGLLVGSSQLDPTPPLGEGGGRSNSKVKNPLGALGANEKDLNFKGEVAHQVCPRGGG